MSNSNDTPQLPGRPQMPTLKSKGFQLHGQDFTVGGIARVGGARLQELLNPSALRLKWEQKHATEEAYRLFNKAFFAAQLKHYDIPFHSSHKRDELLSLLKNAVSQGKCNRVPQSVLDIAAAMKTDYAPLYQKWQAECAAWDAEKKQRDDEAFAKCKTPGERANCDLDRFMDMYFLTNGKPDKSKTPKPLALSGFQDRSSLHSRAERVPGLETCSGGPPSSRELCIGWDRSEVFALASRVSERAYEAEKAQQTAEWEQQMARHRRYIARSLGTGSGGSRQPDKFDLARCLGSYIIQCDEIADQWPDVVRGHTLTMDISKGKGNTLLAAYDFGIIEGTMILSLSEDTLKAIVGGDTSESEASRSDDFYSSEDDGDGDEEGIHTQQPDGGIKRKAGQFSSLARATASAVVRHPVTAKRRKTGAMPSLTRRVYLRLRGRETGEGEIIPDPDSGHIDFLSNSCATFAGLVYHLTFVAKNVEFRGYKVSDTPRVKPEAWEDFSYEAYEHARVGRWY
ncbi:hypothetical protein MKX07_002785 [Trichoderma sp. CBMAI-0711]|nr:hypothetical protein MKX07_002785 [Trichoderma sp. CBMAI-0711]